MHAAFGFRRDTRRIISRPGKTWFVRQDQQVAVEMSLWLPTIGQKRSACWRSQLCKRSEPTHPTAEQLGHSPIVRFRMETTSFHLLSGTLLSR